MKDGHTQFDDKRAALGLQTLMFGFLIDPANDEYRRGYLAALLDVYEVGAQRGYDHQIKVLRDQLEFVP
jgi:hypothetical protein